MLRSLLAVYTFLCLVVATPAVALPTEGFRCRNHHVPAAFTEDSFVQHGSLRSRQTEQSSYKIDEDICSTYDPTDDERILMARAHHEWTERNQGRSLQESTIQIPTYIHMLLEKDAIPLTDSQVKRFVNTLNKGFKSSPFQFVLYDTNVIYNNTYARCREEAAFKQETRTRTSQDGSDVLHIWICDTTADVPGSMGYTYFPPITQRTERYLDGIVAMTPDTQKFDQDSILYAVVHEVGHWLGLLHTFEGGCSTETKAHWGAYEAFHLIGDGVTDTPAHVGPTFFEQGGESCWQDLSPKLNTCPDTKENEQAGMDTGDDPVDNFMNYLLGSCYAKFGSFSHGQVERMVSQYETFRVRNVTHAPPSRSMPAPCFQSSRRSCVSHDDCCGKQRCITRGVHKGAPKSKCRNCRKEQRSCSADDECCDGMSCQRGKCAKKLQERQGGGMDGNH